jgi:hypothetical protein
MGIGGIGTTDVTTDRIMATTDRIMAMATTDRIMAMDIVGTTIVGGNPGNTAFNLTPSRLPH